MKKASKKKYDEESNNNNHYSNQRIFHESDSFEISSNHSRNIKAIQDYKNQSNLFKHDRSISSSNQSKNKIIPSKKEDDIIFINKENTNKSNVSFTNYNNLNENSNVKNFQRERNDNDTYQYYNDIGNFDKEDYSKNKNENNEDFKFLKRRKFVIDNKKKFGDCNKYSYFNSEEMYKIFNKEIEIKEIKNKVVNFHKDQEDNPGLKKIYENRLIIKNDTKKNNLSVPNIKIGIENQEIPNESDLKNDNTNLKIKSKYSSSLKYLFNVNDYKYTETSSNIKSLNENSIIPNLISPENPKSQNHLHSYSILQRRLLTQSSNTSGNLYNSNMKINCNDYKKDYKDLKNSINSLKSHISDRLNISRDSSKFSNGIFNRKENSMKFSNKNNYYESDGNLKSSNSKSLNSNLEEQINFKISRINSKKVPKNLADFNSNYQNNKENINFYKDSFNTNFINKSDFDNSYRDSKQKFFEEILSRTGI